MRPQCRVVKPNGDRCQAWAYGEHGYCWSHHPDNAEARRRYASKGARARGNSRMHMLDDMASELYDKVERGELEPSVGNTLIRILQFRADLIRLERDSTIEDLIEQFEALKHEVGIKAA